MNPQYRIYLSHLYSRFLNLFHMYL
jgi:hypothetical protein